MDIGGRSSMRHLYNNSQKMSGDNRTLTQYVESDMFDVALQLLEDRPELAQNVSLLEILARKPFAFKRVKKNFIMRIIIAAVKFFNMKGKSEDENDTDARKLLKIIWGHATRMMYYDEIEDMSCSRILFAAAETGNLEFIVELLRTRPDLVTARNDDNHTIFHIAVIHRQEGIYNLLYEIGGSSYDICEFVDKEGNNIFHLVGKSSRKASGASLLLMQREILWFKEVEAMMPPHLREEKNKDGQTPYELFSKENEELVSKGLKWMKDCIVVAALIFTVACAVGVTVPGGYNQENGIPIFIHERSFLVFVIGVAISFLSSSISLLMFLSTFTSHQNQRDFLFSLPRKLMIGLSTLFISVAALMITFSARYFVICKGLK